MGALLLLVEHCHAASRLMRSATALQHMRKNQYEEALFRCEDDRYELDMVDREQRQRHPPPPAAVRGDHEDEPRGEEQLPHPRPGPHALSTSAASRRSTVSPPLSALGCIGSSSLKQC